MEQPSNIDYSLDIMKAKYSNFATSAKPGEIDTNQPIGWAGIILDSIRLTVG